MTNADAVYGELLVVRCLRGDATAPGEMVGRFQRPLLYYLRRIVGSENDAWDVSQETWVRVFRALPTLRDHRALPAFLYQTARNAAFAYLRRRHPAVPIDDATDAAGDDDPIEDAVFAREQAERLHAALEALPLPFRDVLTLHFLQDLSIDQIADVVGVPAGTVKSRIHHAKRALRRRLDDEGGSP